jgi:hypothetical protein
MEIRSEDHLKENWNRVLNAANTGIYVTICSETDGGRRDLFSIKQCFKMGRVVTANLSWPQKRYIYTYIN